MHNNKKTIALIGITLGLMVAAPSFADQPRSADQIKTSAAYTTPGEARGFNPQPEPPKDKSGLSSPGSNRAFNPQPEPPHPARGFNSPGSTKGFNPQPEPPEPQAGR